MKKAIFLFLLLPTSISFAQNETRINYSNFNYALLERMVLNAINDYRVSKGLKVLQVSTVLKDSYSTVTASINAKQDRFFHTQINMADTVLASKLYKDYTSTNNGFGEKYPWIYVRITQTGEIIGAAPDDYSTTYEDLAISMLHAWLNSPPHKKIIETKFVNTQGHIGQISCCIKKSKSNTFYFAVGFVTLDFDIKTL